MPDPMKAPLDDEALEAAAEALYDLRYRRSPNASPPPWSAYFKTGRKEMRDQARTAISAYLNAAARGTG